MTDLAPFEGFSQRALDFYLQLEDDNTKEFWLAHKAVYDTEIAAPMKALLAALESEFGPGKMFRPYRDVRFSTDKTPYKTAQGAVVGSGRGVGYYVQLSGDGLLVGGGFRSHSSEQVDRYRVAVDNEHSGGELAAIVTDLRANDFSIEGAQLKTKPKGYAADHPRIELLRFKDVLAIRLVGNPGWLSTPRALDEVRAGWGQLGALSAWVNEHVGPA